MRGLEKAAGPLACLVLALAGCGSVETRGVAFRAQAPRTDQVDLYLGKAPERPYFEVGLVQAVGTGTGSDEATLLRALRGRGLLMGCDAVVRVTVELGQTAGHAMGVCVRWAEAEVSSRPAEVRPPD